MKNSFEIRGDVAAIILKRRNGSVLETIIDVRDLELARSIEGTWYAGWQPNTKSFYVQGNLKSSWSKDGFRKLKLHRWIMGEPKELEIDHINGDTLDNRRSNLRAVTNGQNQQNVRRLRSTNTSGIRGVNWHKRQQKWNARVGVDGRRINIGSFDTLAEAAQAVKNARMELMPFSPDACEVEAKCNV